VSDYFIANIFLLFCKFCLGFINGLLALSLYSVTGINENEKKQDYNIKRSDFLHGRKDGAPR